MFTRIMTEPLNLICDRCRAEGVPGVGAFASLGDLLAFAPVPRRARVGGWDAGAQRGFIAALAMCGSPATAAAAMGRAPFGIDRLREAPGNDGFLAAYDRAMALYRDKQQHRLAAGLAALAQADRDPGPAPAAPAPPVTAEARERLHAEAMHRAIHGTEVPVFHGGRRIGTRRVHSDALAMQLLRAGPDGGGGGRPPRADWITDPHEIRIHNLMKENKYWVRSFAESVARAPNSFIRKHRTPWRWDRLDPWLEQLALARQAFRQYLADEPAKATAWQELFGGEVDPRTTSEGIAVLAALLHCIWPEMAEYVDKVGRNPMRNDLAWERMLAIDLRPEHERPKPGEE